MEIVSKSGLKANLPGSRGRAKAGLVEGLNTEGCEAAAHAARGYVRDCRHRSVLLKIDISVCGAC